MISLEIPKDLNKYQPKFMFGLTVRELIFTVLAVISFAGVYVFLNQFFIVDFSFIVAAIVAFPFILFGYSHPYNMNFEQFLKIIILSNFIYPKKRKYKTDNLYELLTKECEKELNNNSISDEKDKKTKKTKVNKQVSTNKKKQVSSDPDLFCAY